MPVLKPLRMTEYLAINPHDINVTQQDDPICVLSDISDHVLRKLEGGDCSQPS